MLHHRAVAVMRCSQLSKKHKGGARLEVARDLIEDRGGIGTELRIAATTLTLRQTEGLSDGTGRRSTSPIEANSTSHAPCG